VIILQRIKISSNEWKSNFYMNDCLPADQFPEAGGRWWVQCENSLCLAVADKDGKWKSFSNGREIFDVISYCPLIKSTVTNNSAITNVVPASTNRPTTSQPQLIGSSIGLQVQMG
jgi:hypothetical protein